MLFSCIALLFVTVPMGDAAQPATAPPRPKGTGRLWNLTSEPFTYQLARTSGEPWSQLRTLPPGKYHEVKVPKSGETSEWLGLNNYRDPSITVKFPVPRLGGVIKVTLPAKTARDEVEPNWYLVRDSNNFNRLIQAKSVDDAKAREQELKKRAPYTPEKLEEIKETLRANYVLYDN